MPKIEKVSLVEQVYNQIERMIKEGEWQVGERIPKESDLMELFGVSRNTLREAIRALVQVGLLETKQGDGTFVTASSELNAILQKRMRESTMIEILEVRHAIEREAATLAALRRTDEEIEEMKQYSEMCRKSSLDHDFETFVKADWNFHCTVLSAARNQLLMDMYINLFEKVQLTIHNTVEMPSMFDLGHQSLIQAIENKNPEEAARVVDEYIMQVKQQVQTEE